MRRKSPRMMMPMMITVPVADPPRSARFYEEVCGPLVVVTAAESHAMLAFPPSCTMLYLERREWNVPVEFSMQAPHGDMLEAIYANWSRRGGLIHTPLMLWRGLGPCFVGVDLDGNRVRVLAPLGPARGAAPIGVAEPAPRERH